MILIDSNSRATIGQVLARLRSQCPDNKALYKALHTTSATYLKVEREERELSFLMALKLCKFYQLDLHEFISMLSDEELLRQDYSVIRVLKQLERKKQELAQAKSINTKSK